MDDFFYEEFLELMDEFKEKSKDVDFGGLNDAVNEVVTSGYPYHKYLSSLGEGGRIIKGHYDASKRYNNCRDAARRKNELYQELFNDIHTACRLARVSHVKTAVDKRVKHGVHISVAVLTKNLRPF